MNFSCCDRNALRLTDTAVSDRFAVTCLQAAYVKAFATVGLVK